MWGTTITQCSSYGISCISTHVPRVGYNITVRSTFFISNISTHVPRVGYNTYIKLNSFCYIFQLTYPVWGTTGYKDAMFCQQQISTHVPRVGYNEIATVKIDSFMISTHVPRVGYNLTKFVKFLTVLHFNSRTPCGVQHKMFFHL